GDSRVSFQNGKIRLMGRELDRDPVPQAKAQASWLRQHFEQAGLNASVKPVVVFPGWFVESGLHDSTGVWVLEPKGFAKILFKQSDKLTTEECGALATALSAYVRSHEPRRN
ncbi:MAG: nuclease-related domain-containing protein, partial [Gammaproteobacteria bacterium]|nr:nuclease-related domain-containing protein [Gammaproteobacteria bacterium]